ncbi:MAG: hypothetical protein ACOX7P_01465 [Oscillospiraceae bacterium]|jgi:hypothetical protein
MKDERPEKGGRGKSADERKKKASPAGARTKPNYNADNDKLENGFDDLDGGFMMSVSEIIDFSEGADSPNEYHN